MKSVRAIILAPFVAFAMSTGAQAQQSVTLNMGGTSASCSASSMTLGAGGSLSVICSSGFTCSGSACGTDGGGGGTGTLPSAPTIGTATAGNGSISVSFTAGAMGSGTLVNYTAECGGIAASGSASPVTVGGLANGASYTCRVRTTTTVGSSGWSASSNAVIPTGGQQSASCGANQVFSAAAGDKDWVNFNTNGSPFPGAAPASFESSGDAGTAVRFVPDGALNGGRLNVQVLAGYGGGGTLEKEVVVSACPHSFAPVAENIRCRITTIQYGRLRLFYGSGSPSIAECALNSGQSYYINVRPLSKSGQISTVLVPIVN